MSDAPAADAAPKKSKKGLIIIIAAVVLLGGGGAGAYFAFAGKGDEHAEAKEAVPEPKLPPIFVGMDQPFVVNFEPGANARFLQITLQFMTRDAAMAATLEHLNPIIRNDLLLLFGNKTPAEVSTQEGKEALRAATLEAVRKIIAHEGGKPEGLEAAYFTTFVMQ